MVHNGGEAFSPPFLFKYWGKFMGKISDLAIELGNWEYECPDCMVHNDIVLHMFRDKRESKPRGIAGFLADNRVRLFFSNGINGSVTVSIATNSISGKGTSSYVRNIHANDIRDVDSLAMSSIKILESIEESIK